MDNGIIFVDILSTDDGFCICKDGYTSPKTDDIGFVQQLRDLNASPPKGYGSAEMWVYDYNRVNTEVCINASIFSRYFKSI